MRYVFLVVILVSIAGAGLAGFRGGKSRRPPLEILPDMDRQPKLRPQAPNGFFADGLSSRPHLEGTIARGSAFQDLPLNTGRVAGTTNFVENIPVAVTSQLMARGRERFNIYCAPCHGETGDGKGITSKYGMANTKSLHDLLVVPQADGEIFNTITQGKNTMGAYGGIIPLDDRWAIVAYVRALQRSRLAILDDVPEADRAKLKK